MLYFHNSARIPLSMAKVIPNKYIQSIIRASSSSNSFVQKVMDIQTSLDTITTKFQICEYYLGATRAIFSISGPISLLSSKTIYHHRQRGHVPLFINFQMLQNVHLKHIFKFWLLLALDCRLRYNIKLIWCTKTLPVGLFICTKIDIK